MIDDTSQFIPICNIDSWPKELRDEFDIVYNDMMQELKSDERLEPLQRQFFTMIDEHGGGRLGMKKALWRMLIEHAFKEYYKAPQEMEFLMYDKHVENKWYQHAEKNANEIIAAIPSTLIAAMIQEPNDGDVIAITSWKPGHDLISTQIESTKCIVGNDNIIIDTLPFATHPKAKTSELIFDTAGYTSRDKAYARKHNLLRPLHTLLQSPWGIAWIDNNKLILDEDPNSKFDSIFDVLEDLGFIKVNTININHGDSFMYIHRNERHVAFTHGPLGIGGDSRTVIGLETKVRRCLTTAVHTNVSLMLLQNLRFGNTLIQYLSPDQEFGNCIKGMLMQQMGKKGLHQGRRQVAAVHKFNMRLDTSTNAILHNNLAKGPIDDQICANLRHKSINGRDLRRPGNDLIVSKAHHLLSCTNQNNLRSFHATMLVLFLSDKPTKSKTPYKRFDHLIQDSRFIRMGSSLYVALREVRTTAMKNRGNRNKYVHKVGGIQKNYGLLERINDEVQADSETKYWIWDGAAKKGTAEETLQLPSLPNSIDQYEFIPEEHYVYEGLKSALLNKKVHNPNTNGDYQFTMPVRMYPFKEKKIFINTKDPSEYKLCQPRGRPPKTWDATPGSTFHLCAIRPRVTSNK